MKRLQNINSQLHPKFRYTCDDGCLTLQQRHFYEQNGYILIKNFLKDTDIQKWRQRFIDYCDGKVPLTPSLQVVKDIALAKSNKNLKGEAAITKVQNFQFDDQLFNFCTNPDLAPYLKSFCGPNVKSVHTMYINKPPNMGSSSRHPFHQDLAYFPFRPADRIVAAWASFEDATKQNGSLNIYPGSHKGEFYKHVYPEWEGKVNKAYFGIEGYKENMPRLDLEMKKGDIVFFHPLLVHGSGQNKSQGYRKSMCCHFADAACTYVEIQGNLQKEVVEEVMSYARKKFKEATGTDGVVYQDLWRMKARLVCGEEVEGGL